MDDKSIIVQLKSLRAHCQDMANDLYETCECWEYDVKALNKAIEMLQHNIPIEREKYHEDMGDVLWWRFPIEEPPYCGSDLDENFNDEYYTHFTRLPIPDEQEA